jgi:exodeoxyribonuclease VII large subunit
LRELNQCIAIKKPDFARLDTQLNELDQRLCRAVTHHFDTFTTALRQQQAHLYLLNPESVLERGYSIVYDKDNKVLRKSDQINVDDTIQVTFAKGWSKAKILEKGK